jgi:hypothetical protein
MRFLNIILIAIFSGTSLNVFSQSYATTLGLRLGNNDNFRMAGITLQQRIHKKMTFEGIVQTDFRHNHSCHMLGEAHKSIISKRLNFYLGVGLSAGLEENHFYRYLPNETISTTTYHNGTLGIDLLAGLELTLLKVNISLDYKPNFNMVGRNEWYQGQVGVSARTVLISGKSWKKNYRERQKRREPNASSSGSKEHSSMGRFFHGLFDRDEMAGD